MYYQPLASIEDSVLITSPFRHSHIMNARLHGDDPEQAIQDK